MEVGDDEMFVQFVHELAIAHIFHHSFAKEGIKIHQVKHLLVQKQLITGLETDPFVALVDCLSFDTPRARTA
tara:strand:- start:157 stop:372 length:216 start_codon:yes stop_codon:yes gene_type:complete